MAPLRDAGARVRVAVDAHPLLAVGLLAALVGVGNLAWVVAQRDLGGLDVDEAGYLTQAFRWQRMLDPAHPFAVYSSVLDQDKGPVTMLVSVLALLIGPNTIATAFVASGVLHGVSAVAVAGIANRLAGARSALISGLVVLAIPGALVAARSYQLAPAVGATLACAVWALVASDRGRRTWPMIGFGLSVGLLLLSRTMAVAFVPGVVLAAGLHVDWGRRVARNVGVATGIALVVAAPWWWAQREPIFDYLFGYGYGDAASGYGPNGLLDQIVQRWLTTLGSTGPVFLLLGLVVVALAAVQAWSRGGRPAWVIWLRSAAAVVWIPVGLGMAALMSTANMGMYFELPLILLAVPGVAWAATVLSPASRQRIGALVVLVAVLTFGVSAFDSGARRDFSDPGDLLQSTLFVGLANFQRPTLDADPRLASPDNRSRREAMDEWWEATLDVVRAVDTQAAGQPVVRTVCGSHPLVNANTFILADELEGQQRDSETHALLTTAPVGEMEAQMEPRSGDEPRIVVIVDSRAEPFPGETSIDTCASTAARLGWQTGQRVSLPANGGVVEVLVHPDDQGA